MTRVDIDVDTSTIASSSCGDQRCSELNGCSMSRSADRLRSSGEGRERRGPRHEEITMPKHLLHANNPPQELAGGRS
jgi:hypothetical protein